MTSQDLLTSFHFHLASIGDRAPFAGDDTPFATVFGSDEFRVDLKKSCVEIPINGDLQMIDFEGAGASPDIEFGWAAIFLENGEWSLVFGCENPFLAGGGFGLPSKDGIVMAMPNAFINPLDRKVRRQLARKKNKLGVRI